MELGQSFSKNAVKKIFKAKGRAQDNPLIVHVANIDMVKTIVENIGTLEQKLIRKILARTFNYYYETKR